MSRQNMTVCPSCRTTVMGATVRLIEHRQRKCHNCGEKSRTTIVMAPTGRSF